MLMYSPNNPNEFDYENEIQVLQGHVLELPAGEKLEVISSRLPTEAAHETLLYSKEMNSLFASDIFDKDKNYITDFLTIVNRSNTQEEAKVAMIKKYPSWKNTDFILNQSLKTQFELKGK